MDYNKITAQNDEIEKAFNKYANMVRRICYIYLRNQSDVEDTFQEVFLKLITTEKKFNSDEHEKAWICRVTINKCKDISKSFSRTHTCSLEDAEELSSEDKVETDVMEAVLSLPTKLKDVIYLFYYQNYTAAEIAQILDQKENTVYSHLHRAKKLLRKKLGGYQNEQLF